MSHMPFARRYRPQRFLDVVGQEPTVQALKNAVMKNRAAHAYIFSGTRGSGKTTLARILAKAVNCLDLHEGEPCLKCICCQQIATGNSLDIIEIDGASHRGIDDIRQIQETVNFQPSVARFKIFVIDEVHMLTKEAFNALLKTLEEPPKSVKFIFATTEPHKVPATILSRCQRYFLKRISLSAIYNVLETILKAESITYEKEAVYELAKRADGSLRDSLSLLDQLLSYQSDQLNLQGVQTLLGLANDQILIHLEQAIQSNNSALILKMSDELFLQGIEYSHFLEQLQLHYRTMLAICCHHALHEMSEHAIALYRQWSSNYNQDALIYILDFLAESLERAKSTTHLKLHLEVTLLHLVKKPWLHSFDTLLQRLNTLEQRLRLPTTTQNLAQQPDPLANVDDKPVVLPPPQPTASFKAAHPSPTSDAIIDASKPLLTKNQSLPNPSLKVSTTRPINHDSQSAVSSPTIQKSPQDQIKSMPTLLPGRYDGLVQFAMSELGGHLRQ